MLFWTRAALCIGTVTVMAVDRLPAPPRQSAPAEPVAGLVGQACAARPDLCATLLTKGVEAVARPRGRPEARPRPSQGAARDHAPVAIGLRSLT